MCVNDPARICIVPIKRKYYSDTLAIVPVNGIVNSSEVVFAIFMTAKEVAEKWSIADQRVLILCL